MKTKLKNVATGEVAEVFSLAFDAGGRELKGLAFSRERNQWTSILVQWWNAAKQQADVYWVPAVPGVDC